MRLLITGSNGFVGKNLRARIMEQYKDWEVMCFDINDTEEYLRKSVSDADFIVHLAGVNRPKTEDEFVTGNADLTARVCSYALESGRKIPILITSSIQSDLDNPYGRSKRSAEEKVFEYAEKNDTECYVFKLPNLFGKWCRPNYNSAVATFCNNIANELPIQVNDPERVMTLLYIDDLVDIILECVKGERKGSKNEYCKAEKVYTEKLGRIAEMIREFHDMREDYMLMPLTGLAKPLYSTYLSYLPKDKFSYKPICHKDQRGLFAELIKTETHGQVSISTTEPGITRGNHWHDTKTEKFIVVKGTASLKFRNIFTDEVIEYIVSGDDPEIVDIPTGYTHSITNIGDDLLVTIIWANELLDKDRPDTFYREV